MKVLSLDFRMSVPAAVLALALAASSAVAAEADRGIERSYAAIVEKVAPSVASVYATYAGEPVVVGQAASAVQHVAVQPEQSVSFGSAIIVDPSGLLLTTAHTVEGAADVTVGLLDGREFPAEIALFDRRSELAVLRIKPPEPLPALTFADSDGVRVGDFVIAIGNPYAVGQTITHGIVSAVGRSQLQLTDYQYYIQTDAPINPGNSGGALVDMDGKVVGITTAIFSRSGGSQGIGFAVPGNMASFVLAAARSGKTLIRRPWTGAKLEELNPLTSARLGVHLRGGALITRVADRSPAADAGLQSDDIITSINGYAVTDSNAFEYRLAMMSPSGKTQLGIRRNRADRTVEVALAPAPETRPRATTRIRTFSPMQGLTVENLSPAVAEELGLNTGLEGVAVVDVDKNSPAFRIGFLRGDILLRINTAKISNAPDVERLLQREKLTQFEIERGGERMAVRTDARKQPK